MSSADSMEKSIPCSNNGKLPTTPYLAMGEEELIKQYAPSMWTKRDVSTVVDAHVNRLTTDSNNAKEVLPFNTGIPYRNSEKQKLDLLLPDSLPRDCPIFVYIHGGYWHALSREMSTFATLPIYQAGGGVVAVGYDLAPTVTLAEIVNQVQKAVTYVLHLAKQRGSRGVYLCGHSAGGHLAAAMLTVNWKDEAPEFCSLIKGAVLVSGLYDVRPVVKTPENDFLHLSEQEAWEISPYKHIAQISEYFESLDILVAVGSDDSPEFKRQSLEYNQLLLHHGIKSNYQELVNEDHFSVIERLSEAEYSLTLEILKLMSLGGSTTQHNGKDFLKS